MDKMPYATKQIKKLVRSSFIARILPFCIVSIITYYAVFIFYHDTLTQLGKTSEQIVVQGVESPVKNRNEIIFKTTDQRVIIWIDQLTKLASLCDNSFPCIVECIVDDNDNIKIADKTCFVTLIILFFVLLETPIVLVWKYVRQSHPFLSFRNDSSKLIFTTPIIFNLSPRLKQKLIRKTLLIQTGIALLILVAYIACYGWCDILFFLPIPLLLFYVIVRPMKHLITGGALIFLISSVFLLSTSIKYYCAKYECEIEGHLYYAQREETLSGDEKEECYHIFVYYDWNGKSYYDIYMLDRFKNKDKSLIQQLKLKSLPDYSIHSYPEKPIIPFLLFANGTDVFIVKTQSEYLLYMVIIPGIGGSILLVLGLLLSYSLFLRKLQNKRND